MFPEDQGPAETAIGFTDEFVDAGLAKLDALFGAGYAKAATRRRWPPTSPPAPATSTPS